MSLGQLLPPTTTIRVSDNLQRDAYPSVTQDTVLAELGIDRDASYTGPVLSVEELTADSQRVLDRAIRVGIQAPDEMLTKKEVEALRDDFTFLLLHVHAEGWAPVTMLQGWPLILLLVLAFVAVFRLLKRRSERAKEQKLLVTWESLGSVVGRGKAEIIAVLGAPTSSGMMDFGEEAYQWRVLQVCIELWFKNQICFRDPQRE